VIASPTFFEPELSDGLNFLNREESNHCIRVLRSVQGDRIRIIDGKGLETECEITDPNPKRCVFHILHSIHHIPEHHIHIGIAPTKQIDRIEWFVEKAVEIGIGCISFILCSNSERKHMNMERIQKKAISALKQSGNVFMPEIHPLKEFKEVVMSSGEEGKYIAFLDVSTPGHLFQSAKKEDNLVLIGPEGDFTTEEVKLSTEYGFRKVSLGSSRLRTETAGIAACHILNLLPL
jgi:16S rRNA (uracil1498-N3)-methyltransferase